MRLVVGLGNPGRQYVNTRHNVGFMVVDKIINQAELKWELRPSWGASLAKYKNILYLKPMTYMNLSGSAVLVVSQYYKIPHPDILVIYDDKDLPLGTVRYRVQGSAGGHRGMQSIISCLGTEKIARFKIGIAPADGQLTQDTADFVLARFSKEEQERLPEIITETQQKLSEWLQPSI